MRRTNRTRSSLVLLLTATLSFAGDIHLGLEECINRGVRASRELAGEEYGLLLAKRQHALGTRYLYPNLRVTYSDNGSVSPGSTDVYSKQLSVSVDQFVSDGGQASSARRLEAIGLAMRGDDLESAIQDLRDQLWQSYYGLALAREKVQLQSASLVAAADQLAILDIELRQGSITDLEMIDARLKVKNLEIALARSEADLRDRERSFLLALDLPPDTVFTLDQPDFRLYRGITIPPAQDLFAIAKRLSRDLRSIDVRIDQTRAQIDALGKQHLPQIRVEGSVSLSGDSFPLANPQFDVTFNLDFPFSGSPLSLATGAGSGAAGGYTRSNSVTANPLADITGPITVAAQRQTLNDLLAERADFDVQLRLAIDTAVENHALLVRQITLEAEGLELESFRYEVLEKQWELGEVKRTELISAGTALAERETEFLDRVMELLTTERSLEKLIGVEPGYLETIE